MSKKILLKLSSIDRARLIKESLYFFSALLIIGAAVEFIFPGLFVLYFNVAFLAVIWLALLLLSLIYVRR